MSEPPKVKVPKPTFKVEEAAHADAFLEYLRKTLLDNDMTIKGNFYKTLFWCYI